MAQAKFLNRLLGRRKKGRPISECDAVALAGISGRMITAGIYQRPNGHQLAFTTASDHLRSWNPGLAPKPSAVHTSNGIQRVQEG